jgi:hypothetical protein
VELRLGMPFSDKKIIPGNTEHDGTDGSSVGIPPVLRKRKTSEFRSKLFLGREKPLEFRSELFLGRQKPVLNHFLEEKYPWNSFPNHFWIRKTSEFCSKLFSEEKKPWNSVLNHFRKRKYFRIPFGIIFGREKTWERLLLLAALLNLIISWDSVSFRVMEWTLPTYSESHRMSTLFRGRMKTVPSLFREFFRNEISMATLTKITLVWTLNLQGTSMKLNVKIYSSY